jgi:DNA mismatch endonuclease, patch repair protein
MKVPRPPPPSSPAATAVMKANRARNTGPEVALRRALWATGARGYRLSPRHLPGRPDITFSGGRLAVFVHGCFWHRHGCAKAGRELPKSNRKYWEIKFRLNVERDQRKVQKLEGLGWRVLTVWECEIERDAEEVARKVDAERTITHVPMGSKDQSAKSTGR